MDITPAIAPGRQIIQSYGPVGFRINGQVYHGPVIVTPEQTLSWAVTTPDLLSTADFAPMFAIEPKIEVILLGCGATGMLVPSKLRAELKAAGLAIDAMDTGAVCRTYNVMLSEERRVAAMLFPG